ncbi:hypothetical protein ACEQ8H_006152 [Pleosporales sp. CAS-2024a]
MASNSPISADAAIANLQATVLTARCHNAFFRQKQLKSLHGALRNNVSALKDALRHDTKVSDAEASSEVALALDVVKEHYGALDANKELEEEYRIVNKKNASQRREPWGLAYIEPQQNHTPLFSVITAVSAALAAGNCVALKLENNLRALPSLLRKLLPEAMEPDTFSMLASTPSSQSLSDCFQVFQEPQAFTPTYSQLVSPAGRVIAVVDRTADPASAAKQLVFARFAYGGTSPYAPDLVLVNEYIKQDFIQHALEQSTRFLSRPDDLGSKPTSRIAHTDTLQSLPSAVKLLTQGNQGAILELSPLSVLPPKTHLPFPLLAISPITSLDHAITLVDAALAPQDALTAAYHFASPKAATYLVHAMRAHASFVNHVPNRLLLGPAAPLQLSGVDIDARYAVALFSRPATVYVVPPSPSDEHPALRMLLDGDGDEDRHSAGKSSAHVLAEARREIKEKKRPDSIAVGYFEQGIFIGLAVYAIPLVSCIGATLFFGLRAGLRRWVFA